MKRSYKAKKRPRKPELGTYIRLYPPFAKTDEFVDGTVTEHLSTQFVIDVINFGKRIVHAKFDNWEIVV